MVEKLGFIDKQNINLKTLNHSGLHVSEYGIRRLLKNFYYNLIKWWDTICLDRYTINLYVNLNAKVSIAITDRSIVSCPETWCDLRVDETTSRTKITTSNSYPQVQYIDHKA